MPNIPAEMTAVVTTGNGGYDKLNYTTVPKPQPGPGEMLLRVLAAGMNNTEINTRLGWYSSDVTTDTSSTATDAPVADGGWDGGPPLSPELPVGIEPKRLRDSLIGFPVGAGSCTS